MPSVYKALGLIPGTMKTKQNKTLALADALKMHVSKRPFLVKNRKVRHSASESDMLPA